MSDSMNGDTSVTMTQAPAIVRRPLRARQRSRRTLDQRLSLRFPGLAAATFRRMSKLPPNSRLRQAALCRAAQLSVDAFNRRDLEAVLIGAHPGFEYHPERKWVEAGLVEPFYRGLEGYRRFIATVDEVWGGENYLTPLELIDLGDRFVIFANGRMRAQASGVWLSEEYAGVTTLRDGQPIRVQEYYDHDEALEAVGLSELGAHTYS
jgi:ketosteroid isomerase-like protein